jgi:parallel beta-helix repeat protein
LSKHRVSGHSRHRRVLWGICALVAATWGPVLAPTGAGASDGAQALCGRGVILYPGASVARAVANHVPGTSFCLASGVFPIRETIVPKRGDVIRSLTRHGAILDGLGQTATAIASSAPAVLVGGLVVRHFNSEIQRGAIEALGDGWRVRNNVVKRNAASGINAYGDGVRIRHNIVAHNGQEGISTSYANDLRVVGNTIAYNNTRHINWQWEAGGTKFWSGRNTLVAWNYVHDNLGPGLWFDTDNIGARILHNTVVGNRDVGIYYEISYNARIAGNVVRQNGSPDDNPYESAGITIAASGGVDGGHIYVRDNIVSANSNGIVLMQQDRGTGKYGPRVVRNVLVEGNAIRMCRGNTGGVQDVGNQFMYTVRHNRFSNNRYSVPARGRWWNWYSDPRTWGQWVGYGLDRQGKVSLRACS